MGMSTHVVGFVPPDEKWKKMKAVWDACKLAGTEVPQEVERFFGYEGPDDAGVVVDEDELIKAGAIREWSEEMAEGYEVVLDKLPKHVKVVRVYNSW